MLILAQIISTALSLYGLCVIAWLILTTLVSFKIINRTQPIVMRATYYLNRLCGPPLRHIRRIMPKTGQLDLSPIVLLLLLTFAQDFILLLGAGQNPLFAVINLIAGIIQLFIYALIAQIVLSLLITFNIINRHQPFVSAIYYALEQLVEPALAPIRRVLPTFGNIDLSPMVLIFALGFLKKMMFQLMFHL